ncbi:MAG: DUF1553 domain-containing protein [Bryobacteraceae bacterium]
MQANQMWSSKRAWRWFASAALPVLIGGCWLAKGQQIAKPSADDQLLVDHSNCTFFGGERERIASAERHRFALSRMTDEVISKLSYAPKAAAVKSAEVVDPAANGNLIDKYLFTAMKDAGVAPAAKTTDWEFIRRVTLDLTGRVPQVSKLTSFTADSSETKRAKLADELLASPEFVDKWTVYYGDLFKNTISNQNIQRFAGGRTAFYKWIRDSIASKKPYNQMATEAITALPKDTGFNFSAGELNWLIGGRVTGGPTQDTQDAMAAMTAETFLGISHLNCLLCHNGRGHLDQLSVWGAGTSRMQAWGMAAYFSHTSLQTQVVDATVNANTRYWWPADNLRNDYQLGSTTGNRPARTIVGTTRTVAPTYVFNDNAVKAGANYRQEFAKEITGDFQFARAAVNYVWKEFFGRGIVDPVNQFDPARLDPDNPPPDPWKLQPSNPQLLNALAQSFIDSGYDVRALMKLIVTSDAYQLSSRYDGEWKPEWEPLFARKLARRLWGEELADAIAQTSGVPNTFRQDTTVTGWAMQIPQPGATPGLNNLFINAFLPGNRDDEERRGDGATQQALALMNDGSVMTKVRSTTPAQIISLAMQGTDLQLIDALYLTVLSRPPSDTERDTAAAALKAGPRREKAENLLWSLYNKVDFIFNY